MVKYLMLVVQIAALICVGARLMTYPIFQVSISKEKKLKSLWIKSIREMTK